MLERPGHAPGRDLIRPQSPDRVAAKQNSPRVGRQKAGYQIEERCLPCAVWAYEGLDGPLPDAEADTADRLESAEPFIYILYFEKLHHVSSSSAFPETRLLMSRKKSAWSRPRGTKSMMAIRIIPKTASSYVPK